MKWLVALGLLAMLGGCSSGGGGNDDGGGDDNGGGNTLPETEAELDGTVFRASRAAETQQTPLAGAEVIARQVPGTGAVLARTQTNARGGYFFSLATSTTLPRGRSILVTVESADRRVYGVVNTAGAANSKSLGEVTHLAALAMRLGGDTSFTDDEIRTFETAAREALEAVLTTDADADFTAVGNQAAAEALASTIRDAVEAGTVTPNRPPTVSNAAVTPTQLGHRGGTVNVSVQVADADGDDLTVHLLRFADDGSPPEVLPLTESAGAWIGQFTVSGNPGTTVQLYQVAVVADDGRTAGTPQVTRQISVLPEGRVTLDVLVETLFDESPSRAALPSLLDRLRPRVRRGQSSTRQVNPNQTIRGATVTVQDDPTITGQTGDDGLLLLDVPMRHLDDGQLLVTTSIAGRLTYQQFLVVPDGITLLDGDVIEIDLVLAPTSDWDELADLLALPNLDYAVAPITAFFNVLDSIDLGFNPFDTATFEPLAESDRADDGDYFVANLPAAPLTVSGTFADPADEERTPEFGPIDLPLTAGWVNAVSALLPPQ